MSRRNEHNNHGNNRKRHNKDRVYRDRYNQQDELNAMADVMRMIMDMGAIGELVQIERNRRQRCEQQCQCCCKTVNIEVPASLFGSDDEICITTKNDLMDFLNNLTPVDFLPEIDYVLFDEPYAIVFWSDGTTTKVKCGQDDTYNTFAGLSMCIVKKMLGRDIFKQLKENMPFYEEGSRLRLAKLELERQRKAEVKEKQTENNEQSEIPEKSEKKSAKCEEGNALNKQEVTDMEKSAEIDAVSNEDDVDDDDYVLER